MSDLKSPMTRDEAYDALPKDAKWSCSFGYPGEGGFTEYWRTPTGGRWTISNGPYHLLPCEFNWTCQKVVEATEPGPWRMRCGMCEHTWQSDTTPTVCPSCGTDEIETR